MHDKKTFSLSYSFFVRKHISIKVNIFFHKNNIKHFLKINDSNIKNILYKNIYHKIIANDQWIRDSGAGTV